MMGIILEGMISILIASAIVWVFWMTYEWLRNKKK